MNEALRNAIDAKCIDRLDVAAKLQVDPKTVERWLSGRLPHPNTRAALANLLDADEADLWPALTNGHHPRRFGPEIRDVYPHRRDVPRDVWLKLFASADHEIDILDYTGLFLFEDTAILQLLAAKADAGAHIRVLLGNPCSHDMAHRDEEEDANVPVAAPIASSTLPLLSPLAQRDSLEIHLHSTILYASLFRADDELLANLHIYGVPTAAAPVLSIRRSAEAALFSTYATSFNQTWIHSTKASLNMI